MPWLDPTQPRPRHRRHTCCLVVVLLSRVVYASLGMPAHAMVSMFPSLVPLRILKKPWSPQFVFQLLAHSQ